MTETLWQITARHEAAATQQGQLSHAGRAMTLLEADLQQTRAALTAARAEVARLQRWCDNNDHWQARAEIHDHDRLVYKARAEAAEATAARLRAVVTRVQYLVKHPTMMQHDKLWHIGNTVDHALAAQEGEA